MRPHRAAPPKSRDGGSAGQAAPTEDIAKRLSASEIMVDQSEESLNLLFETLADWEDILKDASEVYPQDDSEARFKPPEVRL